MDETIEGEGVQVTGTPANIAEKKHWDTSKKYNILRYHFKTGEVEMDKRVVLSDDAKKMIADAIAVEKQLRSNAKAEAKAKVKKINAETPA